MMTPSQKIMIADGVPRALFLTPEARRKAWLGVTVRTPVFAETWLTRNEDADTTAFRAQEDERRRQKSLAQIGRMKARLAAKASKIDYDTMRWDPRRSKFVPDNGTKLAPVLSCSVPSGRSEPAVMPVCTGAGTLTKDNAEAVARLNGVWKDSYDKLRGTGRIVMTVGNVLKGLVKRGGTVKWQ